MKRDGKRFNASFFCAPRSHKIHAAAGRLYFIFFNYCCSSFHVVFPVDVTSEYAAVRRAEHGRREEENEVKPFPETAHPLILWLTAKQQTPQ